MGGRGPGLELRMKLAAQKPGMSPDLYDLGETTVGGGPGDPEPLFHELVLELVVEFVAVPVPFTDLLFAVGRAGKRVLRKDAWICLLYTSPSPRDS